MLLQAPGYLFSLPVNLGLEGEGQEGFALGNSGIEALLGGVVMSPSEFQTFLLAISEGSHVADKC